MNSRKGVSIPINSTATMVVVIVFLAIIIAAFSTVIFDQTDIFKDIVKSYRP